MMTLGQYEQNERIAFHKKLSEVESASLAVRKAAGKEFAVYLLEYPATVVERISWLLDGNYGFGSHKTACEVVRNKRMNRHAWLVQTIAALEWGCPGRFAREAWTKLPETKKEALATQIAIVIEEHLNPE
jgi:hypothetical protein